MATAIPDEFAGKSEAELRELLQAQLRSNDEFNLRVLELSMARREKYATRDDVTTAIDESLRDLGFTKEPRRIRVSYEVELTIDEYAEKGAREITETMARHWVNRQGFTNLRDIRNMTEDPDAGKDPFMPREPVTVPRDAVLPETVCDCDRCAEKRANGVEPWQPPADDRPRTRRTRSNITRMSVDVLPADAVYIPLPENMA